MFSATSTSLVRPGLQARQLLDEHSNAASSHLAELIDPGKTER
ncbi:hypothetical protein [Arthrobacter sp. ISL-30]|nr:hypothetical protein [Arthrobacter sp. ISL-30]